MGMATISGQEKQHLIGVISDTHGLVRPEPTRTLEVADFLIHAGDIGKSQVLEALRSVASAVAVREKMIKVRGHTTSQFFINLKDNAVLNNGTGDFGYAVVGKVTEGMDVVDNIAAVPTGNRGLYQNVPLEPVVIQSARRK